MEKFEYRTRRSFNRKHDYENILEVIQRIKLRCPEYIIHESFSGHPADAFDSMSLPENEKERFISDDYLLFFDSADNLLRLNKSLSGKYSWNEIADIIDTKTGIGMNNWHWTLNTYRLKPKYAQLLIDNLNSLEQEILKNYEVFLLEEKKKDEELEIIRRSIQSISTSEKSITDEGGKTKEYTHTIKFYDGEQLIFTERNIFDFGVVVNPAYSVAPGVSPGGLCLNHEGNYYWHEFADGKGWIPVRELTENEKIALRYLQFWGKFSRCGIRM